MLKRGKKAQHIYEVVKLLLDGISKDREHQFLLSKKYRLHKLSGHYSDCWECHIEPDWLLIFSISDQKTLHLERTGTHSDIFNKVRR